ncbi:MAG: acetyl-CoA carboxylase biotin carboxyl carrier protein subunit [Bacteroidales bacterium]|nr:acetyl-CoA carboxylase biotin carboxyl carrier protein subunit [Bacteroidales bacterium]
MKKFSFTIRGNKYNVEILKFEDNLAEVEVNGTLYTVEVDQEVKQVKTPVLVRKEVPLPSRRETKIKKNIGSAFQVKAPLPGNILKVFVNTGDQVSKGARLLTYEAMKMENEVLSDREGAIGQVLVKTGDSVLEGDVLIEIL